MPAELQLDALLVFFHSVVPLVWCDHEIDGVKSAFCERWRCADLFGRVDLVLWSRLEEGVCEQCANAGKDLLNEVVAFFNSRSLTGVNMFSDDVHASSSTCVCNVCEAGITCLLLSSAGSCLSGYYMYVYLSWSGADHKPF